MCSLCQQMFFNKVIPACDPHGCSSGFEIPTIIILKPEIQTTCPIKEPLMMYLD